jgi:hypothetical protein
MNRLPQKVVELTDTLTLAARYDLAGPTSALRRRLLEKDYDQLFVQFRDVIAGLLRDGDLIAADSELEIPWTANIGHRCVVRRDWAERYLSPIRPR